MNRSALFLAVLVLACDRPVTMPATPAPTSPHIEVEPVETAPAETAAPEAAPAEAAPAEVAIPAAPAIAGAGFSLTFDADALAGPPTGIEPVVGDWSVSERDGVRGLFVDGSRWRSGEASASLVDQARRLYGERYAEFLDGVRAFAFFPLAVAGGEPVSGDYRVSVRFFPLAGRIDQAAGIAFGIAPDGSYLGVRANGLEDNLLFFRVERGRRTIVDTIRGVSTAPRAWHTLTLEVRGTHIRTELDGATVHERELDTHPVGHVGLWSKADSEVLFDDFRLEAL